MIGQSSVDDMRISRHFRVQFPPQSMKSAPADSALALVKQAEKLGGASAVM
jgi:hypothetical protein